MSFELMGILMSSIIAPAILGLYKYERVEGTFTPSIILFWVWCITDTLGIAFHEYYSVALINSIHFILEAQLVLLQFKYWGLFKSDRYYKIIYTLFLIFWISEMIYVRATGICIMTYFVCLYGLVFSLFGIQMISQLIS